MHHQVQHVVRSVPALSQSIVPGNNLHPDWQFATMFLYAILVAVMMWLTILTAVIGKKNGMPHWFKNAALHLATFHIFPIFPFFLYRAATYRPPVQNLDESKDEDPYKFAHNGRLNKNQAKAKEKKSI